MGQWMGYFLKIQYEHIPSMGLFLSSLEHLQNSCTYQKPVDLEKHFRRFNILFIRPNPSLPQALLDLPGKRSMDVFLPSRFAMTGLKTDRWETIIQFILKYFGVNINFEQFS